METVSWLGDPAVKAKYLEQIIGHEQADEIIKGRYWEKGKGCAVGCLIHGNDHSLFEQLMGIPEWCARLIDKSFEGLPDIESKVFPRQFVEAVPVGLSEPEWNKIKWGFSAFLLKENIERVLSLEISDELKKQVADAIRGVLTVTENALQSGNWDESARSAARSAAESAARSAWSTAWSAARSAARSAAESAARSAWSAAWSAARSAARSAAESAARSAAESAARSAWSAAWSAESAARSAAESAAWSARSAAESAAWSAAGSAESAARSAAYSRYRDELLRLLRAAK